MGLTSLKIGVANPSVPEKMESLDLALNPLKRELKPLPMILA
jgi:hypothetical protein